MKQQNVTIVPSYIDKLKEGVLDLPGSNWRTANDVAGYTYVNRLPEQDPKYCVRELLSLLGKRFPNVEARLMWHEIEHFQQAFGTTYGPPGTVTEGNLSFKQAAHEWYATCGRQFEKEWYLQASVFDLHFVRNGAERIRGRWLRLLYADLGYFAEAGFSAWEVLNSISNFKGGGLWRLFKLRWYDKHQELTSYWVALAACLMNFELDEKQIEEAVAEVSEHSLRLNLSLKRPVSAAEAALDYFRRLQLAGLGATNAPLHTTFDG